MTPAKLLLTFDYRDCVDRAARICGGADDLAGQVNASPQEVVLWTLGLRQPCTTQFVRILELIHASRT
jgi:hypothetical protein